MLNIDINTKLYKRFDYNNSCKHDIEDDTDGGKILSYVFDSKSFHDVLLKSKLDESKTRIIIEALNNYVLRTNYNEIILLEYELDYLKDEYYFWVKCIVNKKSGYNKKEVYRIWKIGEKEDIIEEIEKFKMIENKQNKVLLPITNSLKREEVSNYYSGISYQTNYRYRNDPLFLVLEYSLDNINIKDKINLPAFIDYIFSMNKHPYQNIEDIIKNEMYDKIKNNHNINHLYDLLNNLYDKNGLSSIYEVEKFNSTNQDENSKFNTIQKILGYYTPADVIIKNARIITEKERKKRPDYLSTYKSQDYLGPLKSEISITVDLRNQNMIEKIKGKDYITLIDINGRRYDVKHNNKIERDSDIQNLKREINSVKSRRDSLNLIIIGVETGRKHTELDKIFSGLVFEENEKKEIGIPKKNKFIDDYIELMNKRIDINPYIANTLHNITPKRLFTDISNDSPFTYSYYNLKRGDIASDFTRLELDFKLSFLSDMNLSQNINKYDNVYQKAYSTKRIYDIIISIEKYLSGDSESDLTVPIKKDTKASEQLNLYTLIRKNFLNLISDKENANDIIQQYYHSLLVNTISLMYELYQEYYNLKDRNPERQEVLKLNKKRKLAYYLASFYLYKINQIEESIIIDNNIIKSIEKRWSSPESYDYSLFQDNDIIESDKFNEQINYFNKGKYSKIVNSLNENEKSNKAEESIQSKIIKSYSYLLAKEYNQANNNFLELLKITQNNSTYYYEVIVGTADSFYYMGKYKDSLEYYKTIIDSVGYASDIKYRAVIGKAVSLIKINRILDSVNFLDKIINNEKYDFDDYKTLSLKILYAETNRKLGKLDKSEKIFNEIIKDNLENTLALNGLGLIYIQNGDYLKARDAFQASVFINGDPIINYIAYTGLKNSIVMEPSKKDTTGKELSLANRMMFQKAYNCSMIIDKVNELYDLPRIFKYSMTDRVDETGNINLLKDDENIIPEWMKPVEFKLSSNKQDDDNVTNSSIKNIEKPIDKESYIVENSSKQQKDKKETIITEEPEISQIRKERFEDNKKSKLNRYLFIANESYEKKDYKKAIKYYQKAYDEKSLDSQSLFKYANSLFKEKFYRKAIGIYLIAYEKDKNNIISLLNSGICYNKLKEYKHAIKIFDYILKINKKIEKAKYHKALSYLGLKKYKISLKIINSIKLSDDSIKSILYEIYFYKGLILYKLGEIADTNLFNEALSYFEKSSKENPDFYISYRYIAKTKIQISKEDPEKIRGTFGILNKVYDKERSDGIINDETLTAMGNLLLKSKDFHHAKIAFEKALSINKENHYALLGLGDSYYLQNILDDAVLCYDELIININDKYTENKILKTITLKRKIRATYKNANYLECLSTIGILKHFTGAIPIEFKKLREQIIKTVDKNDIF